MLKYWIADEKIQSLYSEPVYTTKEAVKELLTFGWIIKIILQRLSIVLVLICTKTINAPSKRVIEKCGFVYEGTLRDYFYMKGEYVGRLYFSILRSEYMQ